jgi:hypothetical protein
MFSGDLLTLSLKLDGTDLDDLKNATVVDVAPLRQKVTAEAEITRSVKSLKNANEILKTGFYWLVIGVILLRNTVPNVVEITL